MKKKDIVFDKRKNARCPICDEKLIGTSYVGYECQNKCFEEIGK